MKIELVLTFENEACVIKIRNLSIVLPYLNKISCQNTLAYCKFLAATIFFGLGLTEIICVENLKS